MKENEHPESWLFFADLLFAVSVSCFLAALVMPAISGGGLDGERPQSGAECFLLPILFFWLLLDYLPIVFANLIFATLTIYYVPFRRRLTLPRALMSVASAAIPIHFLATTSRQVYIGAHLWLLAFVLSTAAHWTQFFLTVELSHDATVTDGFSDS